MMLNSKRGGLGLLGLKYGQVDVILYNMPHAVSCWRYDAGTVSMNPDHRDEIPHACQLKPFF
ncbi:hypothetical protein [Nitrosomonas ureae]|uniref:Uncharacterized protein n=1 Tax=Nitrosomonas ureae TaxID=44577 RepID=A0A0S3AG01_9PROT|nr:hypothetical protein [Nitrosomonas ureae]ALQ50111.1 hypothetical protein ATY38_01980 [Nitrosomonas ureae]PXX11645.1 hypothetical protein C8R27_1278 [Nitrosomonas ureae]SDT90602.1 hypothetical protein SAMN05216406_10964 [Nitrosomonas ureae]SEQ07881.1 hypothetical protein SAMN05421510_10198 [Nitrosomonas ureae]SOD16934.1 hypothetical protein SAMN06297164_0889 [Nitrosomonas ureae]